MNKTLDDLFFFFFILSVLCSVGVIVAFIWHIIKTKMTKPDPRTHKIEQWENPNKKHIKLPKKLKLPRKTFSYSYAYNSGYNAACKNWERWLPNYNEIMSMLPPQDSTPFDMAVYAKVIHKRIRG